MRSKRKGAKHGSSQKTEINIIQNLKDTTNKVAEKITTKEDKPSVSKSTKSKNTDNKAKFDKTLVLLGVGTVFFFTTAVASLNYAFNSVTDEAINTAYEALDSNLIYNGIFIEEVNISGLTKEQAIRRGESEYAGRRLNKTFTICYGSFEKDVTYADLGGSYDIASTVDEAYKLGRSGTKAARIEYTDSLESSKEYLVSSLSIDKSKMKATLNEIANEVKETMNIDGNFDIDRLADSIENSMLIGEEDLIYELSLKA